VLMQEPDLNNRLDAVLLRFRKEFIALVADVEAMFHQVLVSPRDRDSLRFCGAVMETLRKKPFIIASKYSFLVRLLPRAVQPSVDVKLHSTLVMVTNR